MYIFIVNKEGFCVPLKHEVDSCLTKGSCLVDSCLTAGQLTQEAGILTMLPPVQLALDC